MKLNGAAGSSAWAGIRGTARKPFSHAAVGVASALLATGAAAQENTALPTIDLQNDNGSSYQTPTNASNGRIATPLLNTPSTVNVVNEQVIKDQNVSTVKEALRNVSGVTFRAGEGGNQGDSPYIRGFSAQSDIFRDSVRDPGWYTRDAFNLEAVEVYKGPGSFLFGRGSTGGIINLVTKTPKDRNFGEFTVTGNSGTGARSTLDVNGVASPGVSARIVVMGQGYDIAGRDNVEENRMGVAPSLKFKFSDSTTATLSYLYQRERSVPDYGIPFLNAQYGSMRYVAPVARNTWYGILSQPYPDTTNDDVHSGTAKIEHVINKFVTVTNTTRYTDVHHFQRNVFPEPNASVPFPNLNANWTPNRNQVWAHNTLLTNQTDMIAKFNTGTLEHTMTGGVDLTREDRDFMRNAMGGQVATNFINPDPWRAAGTITAPTFSQLTQAGATDLGVFLADQIKINKYFEILAGGRFEQYRFHQVAPIAPVSTGVRDIANKADLFSWRVGAVFHPTENSSIYIMRGTSFNPSADNLSISISTAATALSQANLAPEKNETTEIGVKTDVLGGRLSLAAAVFNTVKTNMRVQDTTTSATTVLNGEVEAPGAEFSVVGKLTDKWQVIASYTYVHARITKTTAVGQINNVPLSTTDNSASIWTTYDIDPKWQIGGGAFFTGSMYGDLPNTAVAPASLRFDAMAAYKITPKSTIQFNIYNLTNEFYAASVYSNWFVPGASRTFAATWRYTW
jgi:catecholate siderophore receptor